MLTRMKTTVVVKKESEKSLEADVDFLLELPQTFAKSMFSYQKFFVQDLGMIFDDLRGKLSTCGCKCSSTSSLDHVFRLRKTGKSTVDWTPIDYLEEINRMRKEVADRDSGFGDEAFKVVKRYGNVIGHIMNKHQEGFTNDEMKNLWTCALKLLHFRKAMVPKNFKHSQATRTLAASMAYYNNVRKSRYLKPFTNHINPTDIARSDLIPEDLVV